MNIDLSQSTSPKSQELRNLALVVLGILVGQFILYGPSLCGRKVLLPLNVLAVPNVYLPQSPETARIAPENIFLSDAIYVFEPARRFAVSEIRAGRLPMWIPYEYGGAPFIEPRFSPFAALQFSAESPVVLAWCQVAIALTAGLGAYAFLRRALGLSFWPSAFAAWCYPLTAFFILWQGFPISSVACWLPWLLLAVDGTLRGSSRLAPVGLAPVTALTLVSGHLDISCQALLGSGLYALWCLGDVWRKSSARRQVVPPIAALSAGWLLGFLLAAPQVLPMLEYTRSSDRMMRRSSGNEERPPVGISALPQTVLPDSYGGYGIWSIGNFRMGSENQLESSATIYTGLIATLVVAPLAWCSRRHRSHSWFCLFACVFGLSWCLNLPGFVQLLRLPGLNMMSHNRLVFISAFALIALAATGLEVLKQGSILWRPWMLIPQAFLAALAGWCIYRARFLPEPLATQLAETVRQGGSFLWVKDLHAVQFLQSWFRQYYLRAAAWCGVALLLSCLLWLRPPWQQKAFPVLGALLLLDLLVFGYGRSLQCDPALYFPPVPTLQKVAQAEPGRILGYNCFRPNLAAMCGLRDIRGYDAADPVRIVDLLTLAADPESPNLSYLRTAFLAPKLAITPQNELRLHPVLNMLGVRYLLFRQPPFNGAKPLFEGSDYWVMENHLALPRVFVPHRVQIVPDKAARLKILSSWQFDPREVACVETPVTLPSECRGSAELVAETPVHVQISANMETPGLVVLDDNWNKGWRALVNNQPAPILITDHALRGVAVPAGSSRVEFNYAPASFAWGIRISVLGILLCLAWLGLFGRKAPPRNETQLQEQVVSS
jgi:hypothetical protein